MRFLLKYREKCTHEVYVVINITQKQYSNSTTHSHKERTHEKPHRVPDSMLRFSTIAEMGFITSIALTL